nr:MFS transporter [Chloroflexia bacterium]
MSELTRSNPSFIQKRRPSFSGGRLFYGWVQVIALSWTELISWGIVYYAFSVLIVPMSRELGWSRVEITGAFSTGLLVSGVASIPIGRWMDRHGARAVMTCGSIAAPVLIAAWAMVSSLAGFYLIWTGLGITMGAILYEPSFAVVTAWFTRHRGRALAILTFFGGLASVVFLPLGTWLVQRRGWRETLLILATTLAVTTIAPHWIFLRHRPGDYGLAPDGIGTDEHGNGQPTRGDSGSIRLRDALRGSAFWWIAVPFAVIGGCAIAVQVHLIPYLQDRGYSAAFAATATGSIGLLKLPGRLIFAPLSERIPARYVTTAVFLLHAMAVSVLAISDTTEAVILFVALFSAGNGMLTIIRATVIAERFGTHAFGGINGVSAFMWQIAVAAGPLGVSLLVAAWGSYAPVF